MNKVEAEQKAKYTEIRNRLMKPPVYYTDPPPKKRHKPIDMYQSHTPYNVALAPFTTIRQKQILAVLRDVAKARGIDPDYIITRKIGSNSNVVSRARCEFAYRLSNDIGLSNFQIADLFFSEDQSVRLMISRHKKSMSE